jgi:hypothetical protein
VTSSLLSVATSPIPPPPTPPSLPSSATKTKIKCQKRFFGGLGDTGFFEQNFWQLYGTNRGKKKHPPFK